MGNYGFIMAEVLNQKLKKIKIYSHMKISRRDFVKSTGLVLASGITGFQACNSKPVTNVSHIISLSFDDGFKKSFIKTAEIYEKYKLSACLNITAGAHLPKMKSPNEYVTPGNVGDFELWNELQKRGHEIMPHGYKHANLPELPFDEATDLINMCLDYFSEHLEGFNAEKSIFNFPFNASSPELEKYLDSKVLAYRTGHEAVNPMPYKGQKRLTCISKGPENIDKFLDDQINDFLKLEGGWFIFNTHGLDGEGWGPITSSYLDELLDRLIRIEHLAVLPVGVALKQASGL
jgi:peptidoglycan/xylan/chitin deacetylase (PgdA/CDA1 family)